METPPPTPDPMTPSVVRVRKRRRETPNVFTLELEAERTEDCDFGLFEPGQFNMLTVFGVGEVPVSVSGDPADSSRLLHTVRGVGSVSKALTRLRAGDALGLRGPFGTGWPMEKAVGEDVILVAGGLGLAPLRPALYRLLAERERYGKILLLYGTRSPDDILFHRELGSLRRRLDIDIEVTVDHAVSEWRGHVCGLTRLISHAEFDPLHSIAFVCGPEIMMRFVAGALRDLGVNEQAIYLSMERNMKCAVGFCGHCQLGPMFVCRDGPVFCYDRVRELLALKEF